MALPFTFIFLAPGAVSSEHRSVVDTPGVALNVVGAVKFDRVPSLDFRSGDEVFQ